jgi:broad specificity phosphatase PhoE
MIVRPGATEFDDQGRMKGSLDMPLSDHGQQQADDLADALAEISVRTIYCAPCESARETAERLATQISAAGRDVRIKVVDTFRNVDHGLWHGKLIDEVRRNHPRVYRQGSEHPDEFCPPGGEGIAQARTRVTKAVKKCLRKSRDELVAMVIPDPMASIVTSILTQDSMNSLWQHETDSGSWQIVETEV